MKRALRGFRRNYFTLQAIQAYASASKIAAFAETVRSQCISHILLLKSSVDDPPPKSRCTEVEMVQDGKPCHCNCYFRRLAKLLLYLSHLFKRPTCRCRYTKTGLAPPFLLQ